MIIGGGAKGSPMGIGFTGFSISHAPTKNQINALHSRVRPRGRAEYQTFQQVKDRKYKDRFQQIVETIST